MNTWLAPLLFATSLLAQPEVRLPDESTGIDGIARSLVSMFDQADIIALGETHQWRLDTDLRIAVVRHGLATPRNLLLFSARSLFICASLPPGAGVAWRQARSSSKNRPVSSCSVQPYSE